MPIYLTLQLTGSAAHHVAMMPGELLPRLFTLTCTEVPAVVFCHLHPKVAPSFPLRSVMLYVARTFLTIFPAEARKHERQTTILFLLFGAKIVIFFLIGVIYTDIGNLFQEITNRFQWNAQIEIITFCVFSKVHCHQFTFRVEHRATT